MKPNYKCMTDFRYQLCRDVQCVYCMELYKRGWIKRLLWWFRNKRAGQ